MFVHKFFQLNGRDAFWLCAASICAYSGWAGLGTMLGTVCPMELVALPHIHLGVTSAAVADSAAPAAAEAVWDITGCTLTVLATGAPWLAKVCGAILRRPAFNSSTV